MKSILDLMKDLGYRFAGTGGGRLYFAKVLPDRSQELREFKTWDDVRRFAEA
jgi:hypothetical protein